ncbi:MAG: hypothetical protein ACJ704_15830 [Nitrososphaeraceae archaeon]
MKVHSNKTISIPKPDKIREIEGLRMYPFTRVIKKMFAWIPFIKYDLLSTANKIKMFWYFKVEFYYVHLDVK